MVRALPPLFALFLSACAQQVVVYPDASTNDSDAQVAVDAGAPPSDSGLFGADAGEVDGDDAGHSGADAGAALCYGDPFDVCEDPEEPNGDRNDEWIDAHRYASTAGCLTGDEITELTGSKVARMCPTDNADYYGLNTVPCDTVTLRMEVRLHMLDTCPAERYDLEFRFGGGILECGEEFDGEIVTCTEDGADRVIRLLVRPGNSVQSWYFAVLTHGDDVRFDYDLQVSIR